MEVGPWRVLRGSGVGVYGFVYRVERIGQERAGTFAMKVARYPGDPRFEREGELLTRVRHPHVPRLHDRGEWTSPDGASFPYLVMDWIQGVTLYEWAARQPRSQGERLRVLAQVARALEATHSAGGVHRDVKGENVLVRKEDGAAMLMDFGSGNYLGASVLTRQPQPPGTPQYQSPEAQRFEFEHAREPTARYKARPADDVYALGMMAYRLFTGRYPPPVIQVEATEEGGTRLKSVPLEPPEKWVELAPELAGLLRRMLSEDSSVRGSAGEVAQALEQTAEAAVAPESPSPGPAPAALRTRRSWRRQARVGAPWPAVAVGVLLAVSAGWGMRWALEKRSAGTVPEAATSGLGDVSRAVPASGEKPPLVQSGIREEVPKKPLPNQQRPPCEKPLVEIKGGCWVGPNEQKPPCKHPSYEWKGHCYWPMHSFQGPATSAPP
jgi:eukaryotic-like serine/threonine-protein kinase